MTNAVSATTVANDWLCGFAQTAAGADANALLNLFAAECYWRDQIALTWDVRQYAGPAAVSREVWLNIQARGAKNFRLDATRPAPAAAKLGPYDVIELYFVFDLPHGKGQGLARLTDDASRIGARGARCFTLFTDLASLNGVTERAVHRVSVDNLVPQTPMHGYEPMHVGQTYAEYLAEKQAFRDHDPDVLIIGGGHGGMSLGARLERMGVSYLIVERNEKSGDCWRSRYESLALHTVSAINHLPYLRTPDSYSDYTPKDFWADWMDAYPKLMQLNYWTCTDVRSGRFDAAAQHWRIDLKLADGTTRIMQPKHVVLATGGVGLTPNTVDYPGLSEFTGQTLHSKHFRSGRDFRNKRVLVMGSATSAFDVCLDLYKCGAQVTMAQRSPTTVVPLEDAVPYVRDYLPGGPPLDIADLRRGAGIIYPLMINMLQAATKAGNERNAKMIADLNRAGLMLDSGPDNTGWQMKLFRAFRGFYFEMGCARAIIDGHIKVLQVKNLDRFVSDGVRLKDGRQLTFDAVIFAVGFMNANEDVVALFGEDIARKVGPRIGIDATGEPLGQAKPLHHRQIWQMYGSLNDMRRLSYTLALQIIAQLKGIVPPLERQADNSLRGL